MIPAGFRTPQITGFVSNDTRYDATQASYYIAKFVAPFAQEQGISEAEAARWLDDLKTLSDQEEYFYSFTGYGHHYYFFMYSFFNILLLYF